jgi:hypothetical protein
MHATIEELLQATFSLQPEEKSAQMNVLGLKGRKKKENKAV